jgi:hypothetical protein
MLIKDQIMAACKGHPDGLGFREIIDALPQHKATTIAVITGELSKAGALTKVGPRGHSRYFTGSEIAAEWVARAQTQEALRTQRLAVRREARQKLAKAKEAAMTAEAAALAAKERKRLEAQTERRRPLATLPDVVRSVNVVQPVHVKVQVIPTPVDTRYRYIPSSKDWQVEISRDQMKRRSEAAGAA